MPTAANVSTGGVLRRGILVPTSVREKWHLDARSVGATMLAATFVPVGLHMCVLGGEGKLFCVWKYPLWNSILRHFVWKVLYCWSFTQNGQAIWQIAWNHFYLLMSEWQTVHVKFVFQSQVFLQMLREQRKVGVPPVDDVIPAFSPILLQQAPLYFVRCESCL